MGSRLRHRLRVMVIGGTGTGKTTLLSALCHGVPMDARVVKVEDPRRGDPLRGIFGVVSFADGAEEME